MHIAMTAPRLANAMSLCASHGSPCEPTHAPPASLRRSPPPLAQPEYRHDQGANEQDVNGSAQGVTSHQSQKPPDSQY
jgi:hypothetical protein